MANNQLRNKNAQVGSPQVHIVIWLLLLASFFKEMVFSTLIPIWHTPDEQAHFAQIAYFAEFGKMPKYPPDLNMEIYESEKLLGTERDSQGNNKFTFHPEYKIEYTESYVGKYEKEINSLPKGYRTIMIKQEAANYPPLYYWLAAVPYNFFYTSHLIDRVFAVRFFSILLGVGTIYISWLIGKLMFPKKEILQTTLPLLVAFHPMLSFVFAGVTSDNLMNFLFSMVIYLSLLMIARGITKKRLLFSCSILILTYLTKPQFILAIPIFALALVFSIFLNKKISQVRQVWLISTFFLCLIMIYTILTKTPFLNLIEIFYSQSFSPGTAPTVDISLLQFIKETLLHTIKEVVPWYWGVFDWLGVVLPRDVNRVINRLMILAALGVGIKLVKMFQNRKREDWLLIFMFSVSLIYFIGINGYNYLFILSHGFPFGIQGRYYFPTITSHMAILLIGLSVYIPNKFTFLKQFWIKILGLGMVALNFIALWVITSSYYNLSDVSQFLVQVSQYKPWFYKGGFLNFWFAIYLLVTGLFIIQYLRVKQLDRA